MAVTFKRGDRKLVTYPVTAATSFAKGELLCLVSNAVKSFTTLGDSGTKAQNQAAAAAIFAGVANVAVTSGNPASIQVATAGVFEFDCASATFNVGDLVAPIGTGAASAVGVSATSVEATTDPSGAIGKVVKKYASATTRVQVEIFSTTAARPNAVGYVTGQGGTVTQLTSKSTGATLSTMTGQITMHNASLAAGTIVSFVLTNTLINANDLLILNHLSGGTPGSYTLNARPAAGSVTIDVRNNTAGALAEAIVIGFAVVKAVTA